MSTKSNSSGLHRQRDSINRRRRSSRTISSVGAGSRRAVDKYDAYTFALRAAYLQHLLSPRARRTTPAAAPTLAPPTRPAAHRHTSSVGDLLGDFGKLKESKSSKLPKDFLSELDKRLTNVLYGKEKSPEYSDPVVKKSFAVFLNEFKRPEFRKSAEKDRRVEGIFLVFFSQTTKILQAGKASDDLSWKLLVDRHSALFVRLITSTLKDNDWLRDRPELASNLTTLENKLLRHDEDLSLPSNSNEMGGDADPPKSSDVKDMPMVQAVVAIFGKDMSQAQSEINEQKEYWTEKAALGDLKMYQTNLNTNSRRTLRSEDFDTEEAYETWKKAEYPELSQMILSVIQSNLELAKASTGVLPQYKAANGSQDSNHSPSSSRRPSQPDDAPLYAFDQPVDVSGLNLGAGDTTWYDDTEPYMFIPPDPRGYYRFVLKEALLNDLQDESLDPLNPDGTRRLFSNRSRDLLFELGLRWRVPFISRLVLFMDVARELYQDQVLELDALDAAFEYFKEPPVDKDRKKFIPDLSILSQRERWPLQDYILNQQIINATHDTLLRDLFECLMASYNERYNEKFPRVMPILDILETHIARDPSFSRGLDEQDRFSAHLEESLRTVAKDQYKVIYDKQIGSVHDRIEFYHIIQLSKETMKSLEKIQKRFRKNFAEIKGVAPFITYKETVLPLLASDLRKWTEAVMISVQQSQEEIDTRDGFELYEELSNVRSIYAQALPSVPFPFSIEALLSSFVSRYVDFTVANIPIWIETAVKQDNYEVMNLQDDSAIMSTEHYHSSSVVEIFRMFNEAIDQLLKLQWADEYQYAKFMTTISKAIGIGIERFCDSLETAFIEEMDRLTPAQEAQASETRQEKWMRMAKDAISTKEKVEPFQFLPASFVKLNNIEFAMQQLDKLQSKINVDACADIIRRNEPAAQSQRKIQKYVFTIKIIEAEDLRACDPNGLSDPYVVLGVEKQRRIAKTRIIYSNLNPRWDESFDITTSGLLNVTATIWDYDIVGDHDCVGRTSIKLDPTHFGDFLPREYSLDLDTQGRLHVRVSMEGEKDDIQFYFGKAFRSLKRTERDMTRKITDKLSAYIHYCLSRRSLRTLTKQNISISSIFANRNIAAFTSRPTAPSLVPSTPEVQTALQPLTEYFFENFGIMKQTLTPTALILVMTRVWKEVLTTIEALLVPPLSDKPSGQKPLNHEELETVFKELQILFDFFQAINPDTGIAEGVPIDVLKSPKYHELQHLNFHYHSDTDSLIRASEGMAVAHADRRRGGGGGGAGLTLGPVPVAARAKSVLHSRNLGTMRKAKEARRRDALQAGSSDDTILRILRMRPEAEKYLRDRARQRERLAAAAAAEAIVRQSLAQGARRAAMRG